MAYFCPACGAPVSPGSLYCHKCGALIPLDAEFSVLSTEQAGNAEEVPAKPVPEFPELPGSSSAAPEQHAKTSPAAESAPDILFPSAGEGSEGEPYVLSSDAAEPAHTGRTPFGVIVSMLLMTSAIGILAWGIYSRDRAVSAPSAAGPSADPSAMPTYEPAPDARAYEANEQRETPEPTPSETPVSFQREGTLSFDDLGIACTSLVNEEYLCPAVFSDGANELTWGKLTFTSYQRTPVDASDLQFGAQNDMNLTGYDRCVLTAQVIFDDPGAVDRNISLRRMMADYYDAVDNEDSFEDGTDSYGDPYTRFIAGDASGNYYVYCWDNSQWNTWEDYVEFTETITVFAPSGFDGVVHGFVNPAMNDLSDPHDAGDVVAFRFN